MRGQASSAGLVKKVWKKIGAILFSVIFIAAQVFFLFVPFSEAGRAEEERYVCAWQDGTVTEETYASAFPDFECGVNGELTLLRGNLRGTIPPTAKYSKILQTLKTGGLGELLSISADGVTRLERLALWRVTQECVWYAAGSFVWNGSKIVEEDSAKRERLVLLSGKISAARLIETGAKELELRAEAEIDRDTLRGTQVERITAFPPYSVRGGAIYLDTGLSVRLVAVLPNAVELAVSGNDYADEGALLAARNLQSLTLPFAGNGSVWNHYFRGEVAHLFSNGKEYFVPASLKRVKITGGILVSHAFYRMNNIEEIYLCGMDEQGIANDALSDCTALKLVHSPNPKLKLSGEYLTYVAPCGCTVFERVPSSLRA